MFDLPTEILLLIPIIVLAYTTNAMIGFGAPLVAVTLGANFMPVDLLVPSLVPLSVIVPGIIAFRHRRYIHRDLLLKQIFPFMGSGLILGLLIYPLLKGINLKGLLGGFVVILSTRELIALRKSSASDAQTSKVATGCWQILAGITHAFYITGGPLLVYSVSRLELDKEVFRSTLCSVWVGLNILLVIVFALNGRLNTESIKITAPLIMVLPLGIVLGEWLHNRFNPTVFRAIIYGLLLCSGIKLLLG
jgi:uncharacterized membrane protein YfcA